MLIRVDMAQWLLDVWPHWMSPMMDGLKHPPTTSLSGQTFEILTSCGSKLRVISDHPEGGLVKKHPT